MASAPDDPGIVTGRVDAEGRLVAADPPLATLQVEAGSALGARLALPQIAAVVRLARGLGVPLSRPVTAAGASHDFDLWVRATIEGDEVALEIEGWRPRPPAAPRLDLVLAADDDATVVHDPSAGRWATDAELKLTVLAPDLAELLKMDPTEAMGQPLTRLLKLDEDEDGTLPLLAGLASRMAFSRQQASPRLGDGVTLLLSGEVLRDEAGNFAGLTGRALPLSRDVPAAPPTAPDRHGFSAGLDRALRTPLDRIIAAADKIIERSDGPLRTDYASYATDIAAAGRHLMSVIQTMGEDVSKTNRVDLVAASSEAISLLAASGEAKRIAVDVMASTRIEAIGGLPEIVQIIVNILGNAIRHSPPNEVVTVSITAGNGRALLTVADRGPGIAPADQGRIFERFERLGTVAPDGTGLGLAIARRLARSMGGDIFLESRPGEGARFTLELPQA